MKPLPTKVIQNTNVVQPDGTVIPRTVVIKGHKIESLLDSMPGSILLNRDDVEIYNGEHCYLTPGLIDLQINGALGCDFNQGNVADIQAVLQQLPRFGITSLLPTVITAPVTDMLTSINALEEILHHAPPHQCRLLGLHLEGPFLHRDYRGIHPKADIPLRLHLDELKTLVSPNTRLVTLAPELDPAGAALQYLNDYKVIPFVGHSQASAEQMTEAHQRGVAGVTHLFNAMKPFHHREPGIIGYALATPELYTTLIADGVHVHPSAIRMVLQAKGIEKTILVSDAMALAGSAEGTLTQFAGENIHLERGRAVNQKGTLAGSATMLDQCIRNLVQWNTLPFEQAIQTATQTPATLLGRSEQLGQVVPGHTADLVLWDAESLAVKATWIHGQLAYHHQQPGSLAKPASGGNPLLTSVF